MAGPATAARPAPPDVLDVAAVYDPVAVTRPVVGPVCELTMSATLATVPHGNFTVRLDVHTQFGWSSVVMERLAAGQTSVTMAEPMGFCATDGHRIDAIRAQVWRARTLIDEVSKDVVPAYTCTMP